MTNDIVVNKETVLEKSAVQDNKLPDTNDPRSETFSLIEGVQLAQAGFVLSALIFFHNITVEDAQPKWKDPTSYSNLAVR